MIAGQARELAEQRQALGALSAENAELARRLAVLERIVSRNSGNSSLPPSSDGALPGRPAPRRHGGGGDGVRRKRGKQPGSAGRWLGWVDTPDETMCHRPAGRCACGADLAAAEDVRVERSHQVHDLPEIHVRVTQHDLWRVRCRCGREHAGALPAEVAAAPSSYGPGLKALAVYLIVYQHVPVERCVQLIADLTGARVSAGFVHSCLARAAEVVADVVKLIKTLITAAQVAGFDETTLRCGPAGSKRYVLAAVTERCSLFFLGARTLESFRQFGVLPAFTGVVVSDRYQNYFHDGWQHITGHQACCAHLLRDFEDTAECRPDAIWPTQAQRALRGLIRAWHTARQAGQPEIPGHVRDQLIKEFRHAVLAGLSDVPRIPGPKHATAQHPGTCWSSAATGKATSCGSATTQRSGPPTTSASAACDRSRPSRRSPGGSPANKSPRTGWTSAATSTPPASTASAS